MNDYLFATEETHVYFLGNVLALLDPNSQEVEIKTFVENLRRVAAYAAKKLSNEFPPS